MTSRTILDGEGQPHIIPDYIPDAWLNRIAVEVDAMGYVHYLWTGWNNGEGHAKVRRAGKAIYCHRDVVERVEGRKLSRWNYVDHKCERKACLNYDCLEPVTPGENTRRGPGRLTQFKVVDMPPEHTQVTISWVEPLDAL